MIKIEKVIFAVLILFVLSFDGFSAPYIKIDSAGIASVRQMLREGTAPQPTLEAYEELLQKADALLTIENPTVMDKTIDPPTGDKHDYLSISRYWYPNPETSDSLPWVRKDGVTNPQTQTDAVDRRRLSQMSNGVKALSLAYYFSGNEQYAEKAIAMISTWFLDEDTRMNPNLQYAQSVPGVAISRPYGMLDGRSITMYVPDAIKLLSSSPLWTAEYDGGMTTWLTEYLEWMTESELGKMGMDLDNNHGSWYKYQVVGLALYLDEKPLAVEMVKLAQKSLDQQLNKQGGQIHELARTKPFSYSCFNLDALTSIALLGDKLGMDMWNYQGRKKKSLSLAVDYLTPVIHGEEFPHPSIQTIRPSSLVPILIRMSDKYASAKYADLLEELICKIEAQEQRRGSEGDDLKELWLHHSFDFAAGVAFTLENEQIRFSVDKRGRLLELMNKNTSTNYAGGGHFWRLIYQDGISQEEEFDNQGIRAEIRQENNKLILVFNEENNPDLAFKMSITVSLDNENLDFDMLLENNDESRIIRECQFPFVRNVNLGDDYELFLSSHGGHRYENVEQIINMHHTNYVALDNKEVQFNTMYPGPAAMNYYVLGSETEGLYIASHDTTFQVTNHYLSKFAAGGINCGIIKYPFLAPGGKTEILGSVLSPYSGSWHIAAKKYRSWADSWYSMPELPEWIKDMTSWQRIIMRHQYGKTLFRYDQMDEILQDGLSAGIKTLFMFGWHGGGHDSEYPDYSPDEAQGGMAALKENIEKFQAGGGQVILYFNGRLIDIASDYYKENGSDVCIKRPDGSESNEFYKFGAEGTALRLFGNKSFVTACPSSTGWQEILKGFIDMAADLGCDGVFFDQLGFMPSMCFDKNHAHKVPFTDVMKVNADNLEELRQYAKSLKPDMGFGIEWISDVTSQHVDFVHTVCGGTGVYNDWEKGEKPKGDQFLELFYYTFPEVIITDREIRDDSDIERRVNFAILKGQRSDVEIYRCRATIAETPHYQAYLAKANALREKYGDIILNGLYSDTDFFEIDNPEFFASSFIAGNQLAVIVSQSHLENAKAKLVVPGYKYLSHDGLNDYTVKCVGEDILLSVNKHGLVVLIFELR